MPPPPDDADRVQRALTQLGVDVTLDRVDGSDPPGAILAAADTSTVIVVASSPWPDGPGNWYATARHLIRRAPCPVLVVPADELDRSELDQR